jgi:hypothetical protein
MPRPPCCGALDSAKCLYEDKVALRTSSLLNHLLYYKPLSRFYHIYFPRIDEQSGFEAFYIACKLPNFYMTHKRHQHIDS